MTKSGTLSTRHCNCSCPRCSDCTSFYNWPTYTPQIDSCNSLDCPMLDNCHSNPHIESPHAFFGWVTLLLLCFHRDAFFGWVTLLLLCFHRDAVHPACDGGPHRLRHPRRPTVGRRQRSCRVLEYQLGHLRTRKAQRPASWTSCYFYPESPWPNSQARES